MKTAIITGITGQDGAYLAELLLRNQYRVIGLTRGYTQHNATNLKYLNIFDKVILENCDLTDITQVMRVITQYQPDEIYNLAAQSSVSISFNQPIATVQFNVLSVLNLLESIRVLGGIQSIKLYQSSSSEMFGVVDQLPIKINSVIHPVSPYAVSKATYRWLSVNYRESYGIFVSCGILFNHESYLRTSNFFVKKIIQQSLRIKYGLQQEIKVGNIDIKRDFGYAKKYVEAMWLMLQQEVARDYIVCSGQSISLRSIVEYVFKKLSISMNCLIIDQYLFRPSEIPDIYGDNSLTRGLLNWNYEMNFFEVLDILINEEENNKGYLNG